MIVIERFFHLYKYEMVQMCSFDVFTLIEYWLIVVVPINDRSKNEINIAGKKSDKKVYNYTQ